VIIDLQVMIDNFWCVFYASHLQCIATVQLK